MNTEKIKSALKARGYTFDPAAEDESKILAVLEVLDGMTHKKAKFTLNDCLRILEVVANENVISLTS